MAHYAWELIQSERICRHEFVILNKALPSEKSKIMVSFEDDRGQQQQAFFRERRHSSNAIK